MVGECYNNGRCYDYLASCYVCSCVLDGPVIWQRAVLTYFRCVERLYVCRICDVSESYGPQFGIQGTSVPSFDWVSYEDVYVVLVCGHSWLMF